MTQREIQFTLEMLAKRHVVSAADIKPEQADDFSIDETELMADVLEDAKRRKQAEFKRGN